MTGPDDARTASGTGTVTGAERWQDAATAAAVLAVATRAVGGVRILARPGPVRDRWLAMLGALLPASTGVRRIPAGISDDRLLGGLDIGATLAAGRPVLSRGVLAEADGGVILAAMAERMSGATAAHLAAMLDDGVVTVARDGFSAVHPASAAVVALDEAEGEEEGVPAVLAERLGLVIDLSAVSAADTESSQMLAGPDAPSCAEALAAARTHFPKVTCSREIVEALSLCALEVGISSLRPVIQTVAAARALAALGGRGEVEAADAALAARLALGPRAVVRPEMEAQRQPEAPEATPDDVDPETREANRDDGASNDQEPAPPRPEDLREVVLAAIGAALPARLLSGRRPTPQRKPTVGARGGRSGAWREGWTRGRPAGSRRRPEHGRGRIDLLATLRAAVPWQRLRMAEATRLAPGTPSGLAPASSRAVHIVVDDLRVARLRERCEALTIFVVDASGSSALNRLAEAKGAVELLLAESYVSRASVAVIAFRRQSADLLLPPTRSLTRAKRALGGLPGGGGTPLAAGLEAARALACGARRRGQTPLLVVLTDAKANVALDGSGGRVQAEADALAAARRIGADGLDALLVDISPRPGAAGQRVATAMAARYQPLPRLDSGTLSSLVRRVQTAAEA